MALLPGDERVNPNNVYTVEVVEDFQEFIELEKSWNSLLAGSYTDMPYLRHEWFRILWKYYGGDFRPRIYIVRKSDEVCVIAPMIEVKSKKLFLSNKGLSSMTNERTNRCDIIYDKNDIEGLETLFNYWSDHEQEISFLELQYLLAASPTFDLLKRFAEERGFYYYHFKTLETPYFDIKGDFSDFLNTLKAKFKSNMRNREKRLSQLGTITVELIESEESLAKALEDVCSLEAMSWKEEEGVSINSAYDIKDFYMEFAKMAFRLGWLRLFFLKLDNKRIAFDYAIEYNKKLYLLRTGYDPTYSAYSPGQLLKKEVFKRAFSANLNEYDFLGDTMVWKRDWTSLSRNHISFFLYRGKPGPLLEYFARFGWKKTLKSLGKNNSGVENFPEKS